MYTEAQLFAFIFACRGTDLSAPTLMQRMDTAIAAGLFADCVWGNMSEAQVQAMVTRFMRHCMEIQP